MLFTIPSPLNGNFTVNINDFDKYSVSFKNALGTVFPFDYHCLRDPIVLKPETTFPSFWMVDKNGVLYDGVEYVLVPYIRFMIPSPNIRYDNNTRNFDETGEMHRTDYRQNLFHPYWTGGVSVNGQGVPYPLLPNPNPNSYDNLRQLMDLYLTPLNFQSSGNTTHGFRSSATLIPKLTGIGEDLLSQQGGFKDGIFMPVGARYLQADTYADSTTPVSNHYLILNTGASATTKSSLFAYMLGLPSSSTQQNSPYILPPLFTDLFSIYHRVLGTSNGSAGRYQWDNDSGGACAVLTFGIQPK